MLVNMMFLGQLMIFHEQFFFNFQINWLPFHHVTCDNYHIYIGLTKIFKSYESLKGRAHICDNFSILIAYLTNA